MPNEGPTGSFNWILHPGDLIVAVPTEQGYRILFRTPSEIELQRKLVQTSGPVHVLRYVGEAS